MHQSNPKQKPKQKNRQANLVCFKVNKKGKIYHAKPTTSANQTTKILGFIDKKGEIVIPIQYDNAWFFQTAWQM
ncbi:WG repeat-containing protein [Moraxella bovis]|uniref:WG repeat-containing protein n=1 Tax=Moraxella bovis TaxID=476 RepID=A0AAQ2QAF4_MORBO|nr:WG repeat-containing protein [Moraxella bovis]AWY20625.1 hypothetical protein DQF64_09075 [Moraxella bovis]UYZ76696.1 WG repeat-containing protein [Moraxella bovis]UYZ77351.1 WG repeat-containing protein [Moraxella bovis]UYZ82171.1 WG repeat-containing protein [Moraxella bovis]UYZ85836.1 WG repeat-containing protein [Moraxella bovis]